MRSATRIQEKRWVRTSGLAHTSQLAVVAEQTGIWASETSIDERSPASACSARDPMVVARRGELSEFLPRAWGSIEPDTALAKRTTKSNQRTRLPNRKMVAANTPDRRPASARHGGGPPAPSVTPGPFPLHAAGQPPTEIRRSSGRKKFPWSCGWRWPCPSLAAAFFGSTVVVPTRSAKAPRT